MDKDDEDTDKGGYMPQHLYSDAGRYSGDSGELQAVMDNAVDEKMAEHKRSESASDELAIKAVSDVNKRCDDLEARIAAMEVAFLRQGFSA